MIKFLGIGLITLSLNATNIKDYINDNNCNQIIDKQVSP